MMNGGRTHSSGGNGGSAEGTIGIRGCASRGGGGIGGVVAAVKEQAAGAGQALGGIVSNARIIAQLTFRSAVEGRHQPRT